ncbi:MAG: transporter substrate-binding domain-containing protein [Nitrospirae bacterium]|nr:transporter substrate-binding domain-containing protein [Nitrospirota bacterium]
MRLKPCLYMTAACLLLMLLGVCFAQTGMSEVTGNNVSKLELTAEERAFIAGKQLRLGVDSARPPFEYIDEKGVYSGISAGFIEACAAKLGIAVVPIKGLTVQEAVEKVNAGEIDVVTKITPTPARAKHLLFTRPYATFPSVIITRKDARFIGGLDDLDGLRVGVLKGLVVEEILIRDHPEIPLIALPNVRTALLDLSTGKFDVFIDNLGTVSYNIDKLGLTNLKIAAPTPYNHDLAFGVRKDWPLLASALDKALAGMSNQEKTTIKGRWLTVEYQPRINWKVFGPIAAALVVVIIFVVIWNRRLSHVVSERTAIQQELKEYAQELESRAAVRSHISRLSSDLQKAVTFEELAQAFMSQSIPLLGADYGVFYVLNKDKDLLVRVASYGYTDGSDVQHTFAIGQGLVGQCAYEKKAITITDTKGSGIRINWGMGEVAPKEILIEPVVHKDKTIGVLELAAVRSFGQQSLSLLEELLPTLAMNIEILDRNLRTQSLLEETREQAKKLMESRKEAEERNAQTQYLLEETTRQSDKLKAQQEQIKETEIWYRGIIESAPDGMLVVDAAGIIIMTNVIVEKIFGYDPGELLGRNVDIMVPADIRDRHSSLREGFMQAAESSRQFGRGLQLRGARKDGSEFPVEIGLSRLPAMGSRGPCACASIRDVTERRAMEESLEEQMDELERFNRLTMNREEKMILLKEEINNLLEQYGKDKKYKIVE